MTKRRKDSTVKSRIAASRRAEFVLQSCLIQSTTNDLYWAPFACFHVCAIKEEEVNTLISTGVNDSHLWRRGDLWREPHGHLYCTINISWRQSH